MAGAARLAPPRRREDSRFVHKVAWASMPLSALTSGDRRLEAEAYLLGGYGIRLEIEARTGWRRFGELARVWQPSRLKGIQVSKRYGAPFLSATQVFDLRPTPRKWLAIEKTSNASERLVRSGMILVTCSGTVGLCTIAHSPHMGVLISHDLLRVEAKDDSWIGWLYAFLRSEQARAMMTSVQYGHVIKHLECAHLDHLPVPHVGAELRSHFNSAVQRIFAARDEARALLAEAENLYRELVGAVEEADVEAPFSVSSEELAVGRRRFEGFFHNREAAKVLSRFARSGFPVVPLSEVAEVWWLTRFKRVFGETGVPYSSAEELFSLNPPVKKRVMIEQAEDPERFYVKAGWLAMACSGQIYGLNGSVALLTSKHEGTFLSHDVLRIAPRRDSIRPGYLSVALGHPALGRPLVIRHAYGTSIPHIDPVDAASIPVIRLGSAESKIADIAERAAQLRDDADGLEDKITQEATEILQKFVISQPSHAI